MRYLLLALFLFINTSVWASPPSRPNTYVGGTVISSVAVTGNEVPLYSYLQSGVDTYKTGSITSSAISPTAGITYSQINLSGGILPGDINTSSTTNIYQFGSVNIPNTFTLGTTHIGDLLYDNGTSIARLPEGTAGRVLVSQQTGGGTTAPIYGFPSGQLGAWVTETGSGSTWGPFQATTDGTFYCNGSNGASLNCITDSSPTPTIARQMIVEAGGQSVACNSHVRKNDYFECSQNTATISSMYFIPIGS